MAGRTYHLRRKRSADLPPMEALRRDARPVRRGVVVRPGIVALAPGVTEMRGFAVALALLAALPAGAVTLVEPTTTENGTPLTVAGNSLWACAVWVGPSPTAIWLRPTATGGGGSHVLPTPAQTADLPWRYTARCLNAQGWGPAVVGVLDLELTVN